MSLFRMLPRFARLISSRTGGGMLSALTSRVGNCALLQSSSLRVALGLTDRTRRRMLERSGQRAWHRRPCLPALPSQGSTHLNLKTVRQGLDALIPSPAFFR